jgi:hypothetical protein
LREILTREAGSKQLNPARKDPPLANVLHERDIREATAQYSLSPWFHLTNELGLVTGTMQAELDSADSGKQSRDPKLLGRDHASHVGQTTCSRFGRGEHSVAVHQPCPDGVGRHRIDATRIGRST